MDIPVNGFQKSRLGIQDIIPRKSFWRVTGRDKAGSGWVTDGQGRLTNYLMEIYGLPQDCQREGRLIGQVGFNFLIY